MLRLIGNKKKRIVELQKGWQSYAKKTATTSVGDPAVSCQTGLWERREPGGPELAQKITFQTGQGQGTEVNGDW